MSEAKKDESDLSVLLAGITRGIHNASYQITQKHNKLNKVLDTEKINTKRKPEGGCMVYLEFLLILLTL